MPRPKTLCRATTGFALADAPAMLAPVAQYYLGHDCDVQQTDDAVTVLLGQGHIRVAATVTALNLEVAAPRDAGVIQLKAALIGLLQTILPVPLPDCRWQGAGQGDGRLPNFRELTVTGATDLSGHMRRLRLAGDDLMAYEGEGIHMRLLIAPPGIDHPQWPRLDANGAIFWPEGEDAAVPRVYTIRAIDAQAGWMDVDFVLHGDNGPGSSFANHAQPGDRLGMTGPLGAQLPDADWYLFAGDETALPAIGRYLETLPADASGHAVIEVENAADRIGLDAPAGIAIHWLFRAENGDGNPADASRMPDVLRTLTPPRDGRRIYCWAGLEQECCKPVQRFWRKELGLGRDECQAMSFWRRAA